MEVFQRRIRILIINKKIIFNEENPVLSCRCIFPGPGKIAEAITLFNIRFPVRNYFLSGQIQEKNNIKKP